MHGVDQALRSLALEHYSVAEIQKILKKEKLEGTVDFVSEGRTTLLFTGEEIKDMKTDFSAAQDAGVDVSHVEWISKEDMKVVCKLVFSFSRIARLPAFSATELVTQPSKSHHTTCGLSNSSPSCTRWRKRQRRVFLSIYTPARR